MGCGYPEKKLYDWKSIPDVLRAELLYPVDKSEEHEFILIASKIIPVNWQQRMCLNWTQKFEYFVPLAFDFFR